MRWLPLAGAVFVACFAASAGLYGSGAGSEPRAILAYYGDHAARNRQIGGFALLLAGCLFLLVFVVVLARELLPEEPLSTVAVISGGGSTLLLAVGNALWAASAFTEALEPDYRMSASTHLMFEDAGFVVVVTAMAFALPFVAAVTVAATRSRRLPAWFAALGAVCVAGLAAAYWYWPLAAYLVWIACASILLPLRRGDPARASAVRAADEAPPASRW